MTLSWSAVRRELLLTAAFAATGAAVAYLVSEAQPERFRSTVAWSLNEDHATLALALDEALQPELERLSQAARRRDVIADALERIDGQAPDAQRIDALVARTETTIAHPGVLSENPAVLRVHVLGATRENAFTHAQALAAALEAWDRRTASVRLDAALSVLDGEIDRLGRDVRTLQVLDEQDAERDATLAERAARIALRDRTAALASASDPPAALVRDRTATRRDGPNTVRDVTASAGLAALLGLGLGLRRPRKRTRAPRREARPRHDPPLLASFPRATEVITLRGAAARLRVRLTDVLPNARPWVIVVAGADEREGATTVACQLAEEWALIGHATLLLDGHLSAPAVAARYGLPSDPSIATSTLGWLQDPGGHHQLLKVTLDNGGVLDVVPQFSAARPSPGAAAEVYLGFPELLARWSSYDAIVVDAAGVLEMADTLLLAPHATGVAMVLDRGRTDRTRVGRAADALKRVGATLLGVVDDDPPPLPSGNAAAWDEASTNVADVHDDRFARAFGRDR